MPKTTFFPRLKTGLSQETHKALIKRMLTYTQKNSEQFIQFWNSHFSQIRYADLIVVYGDTPYKLTLLEAITQLISVHNQATPWDYIWEKFQDDLLPADIMVTHSEGFYCGKTAFHNLALSQNKGPYLAVCKNYGIPAIPCRAAPFDPLFDELNAKAVLYYKQLVAVQQSPFTQPSIVDDVVESHKVNQATNKRPR